MSDSGDAANVRDDDNDSLSSVDSIPPQPVQRRMNADEMLDASSQVHPLWKASRRPGAPEPAPSTRGKERQSLFGDDTTRYNRLSVKDMERNVFQPAEDDGEAGDGDDSNLDSEDERMHLQEVEREERRMVRKRDGSSSKRDAKRKKQDSNSCSEDSASDDEEEARGKLSSLISGAAFGGGTAIGKGPASVSSVAERSVGASTMMENGKKKAFAIRGCSCIGCLMPHAVAPVTDFIKTNAEYVEADALYKLAALKYRSDVAKKLEAQGQFAPQWRWKQLRLHYTLHVQNTVMQRLNSLRMMSLMRSQAEMRLVRADETGKALDKATTELLLKIVQQESKERALFEAEKKKAVA